jgi:hypothetical protein
MAGKKRSAAGRSFAEKAFMDTFSAQRESIGDIGEAFEEYRLALAAAETKRLAFEELRSEALKSAVFSNSQLEGYGYKKTAKLNIPTLPGDDDAADADPQPAAKTTKSLKKQTEETPGSATDHGDGHSEPNNEFSHTEYDAERSPAPVG